MKKLLLLLISILFYYESNAQISVGGYTLFPDAKLMGKFYKPQLSFASIDGNSYLILLFTDPNDYKSFDEESRLLLKFEDDTTVKLPIDIVQGVEKDYDNMSTDFGLSRFYMTYTCYPIEEDTINKILNKEKIVKIRIGLGNSNVLDYDITPKYQEKLIEGLINSYYVTQASDKQKAKNSTDEDF